MLVEHRCTNFAEGDLSVNQMILNLAIGQLETLLEVVADYTARILPPTVRVVRLHLMIVIEFNWKW